MSSEPRCLDGEPGVLPLARAADAARAGAKAAALARAAGAGLPVLPGFVLTPDTAAAVANGHVPDALLGAVREAYDALTDQGREPVIVRSSSTVEDLAESSMAGRFTSVLDVRGWDAFLGAVGRVVESAAVATHAGLADPGRMAVLVQRFVVPDRGGVLFGVDPVSGRDDRVVVAATEGTPDALVGGTVTGARVTLDRRGRVVDGSPDALGGSRTAIALARLAHRAAAVFGAPQDIEWAVHGDDVVLLQSRPITAVAARVDAGAPVFGPGPLAETFPDPLHALERDLWLTPLRDAIVEALVLTGAASRRRLARAAVVVAPGGRAAVDLELLGIERPRRARRLLARVDPRVAVRHLVVAWAAGRLRAALPALARDLVRLVDRRLAAVPPLARLSDAALVTLLVRARRLLRSVHGYEILAGRLLAVPGGAGTAAARALQVLHERGDETDDQLVSRHPVVLALTAPSITGPPSLPAAPARPPGTPRADDGVVLREALRVRARWIQELTARAARELGARLAAAGRLPDAAAVADVPLDRLVEAVGADAGPVGVVAPLVAGPPLPARFHLAADGEVVAAETKATAAAGGQPAGGGRGAGLVRPADALPAPGSVLVVRTLDPALAPLLPGLAGLVAETGSVLAHLAILARELGVPAVVAVPDAVRRFPPGTRLAVDGTTGSVHVLEDAP